MSAAFQVSLESAKVLPEAPSQAELLGELVQLASCLDQLPARPLDESTTLRASAELTRIVKGVLSTVGALEQLDSAEQGQPVSQQHWEPETWVGVRSGAPAALRFGDVCFACSFELNVALRGLERASDDDARLSAAESARRKLYRAIHAILRAAPDTAQSMRNSLQRRADTELSSALAVRRLYAEFRQNLRPAADDSNEAVLTALRYAAGALAMITASPHYLAVRVSDAALLREQHQRLLEWSRSGKPRAAGLQVLEDISTSASLLRDINRRQELRAHDTDSIHALLAHPPHGRADWLTQLDGLIGLDDALDRLTAQLRTSPSADVIAAIGSRLSALV